MVLSKIEYVMIKGKHRILLSYIALHCSKVFVYRYKSLKYVSVVKTEVIPMKKG